MRMHAPGVIAIVAVALGGARSARAETTFEAQAQGAQVVNRVEDLVWALTEPCEAGGDRTDVHVRQCKQLRDARAAQLRAQPILVEAEPTAFFVGAYDAAKKSAPVGLYGCIRCQTPVSVGDTAWSVYAGAPRISGNQVTLSLAYDRAHTFPDAGALDAWKKALGEIRVHYVVKVGKSLGSPSRLVLDVVGFRVTSACTGEVIVSSAPAQPLPPDKRACTAK